MLYGVNKRLLCTVHSNTYLLPRDHCVTVHHTNLCGLEQLAFTVHMAEWPSRQLSRTWAGLTWMKWVSRQLVFAGMTWTAQPHLMCSFSSRSLDPAYVHEGGTREGRQAHPHTSYLSICGTLANISLAKKGHMDEYRVKGRGTLFHPKWGTAAKSHGPVMCLRRGAEWASPLKLTICIICKDKK